MTAARVAAVALGGLLLLGACGGAEPLSGGPADRPACVQSVILISIDTLRPDHLEAYGYERPTSPALAELAARGVLFEQAIAQSPWTLPSHAAMLTSLHPSSMVLGPWNEPGRVPEEAVSIAEVLAAGGLRCAAFVNAGFVSKRFGFGQGFERYVDMKQDMQTTVTRALRWLEELERDERFFLFLHTYDVHEYMPPPETAALLVRPYGGHLTELGEELASLIQDRELLPAELVASLTPEDRRYVVDLYDAALLSVDRALAHLFERLEELGRLSDTLIVITSDHGEEFFEHGATGHGYTLFDENLRVPLILAHPELAARRVASQVRSIDLPPTLAELCGLAPDASWQGASLVPLMDKGEAPGAGERPAFSEHAHFPLVSLRLGGLKYIRSVEAPAQLYDLASDGGEQRDLAGAGDPREPRLSELLEAWAADQAARRVVEGPVEVDIDAELLRQLRELGYTGDSER